MFNTYTPHDIQIKLKDFLKKERKSRKLTIKKITELSGVPNSTIRLFEKTGNISLRNFLLLYALLYDIDDITNLMDKRLPRTMDEVLKNA
ncbi:transcriptional regulator [Escherichia coli]|nr:XRE family transcriptional regulator [Escherichia coli]EFO1989203.1 XRE family transcriptional regulator [Escherichia coli]EFO2349636.1 XRE family transcriptional regulator [Escherichia coli]EFO3397718.1 XRE family transcriptional regulator [Escherichia coli]MDN0724751.1 helix-turn-helix transcriptional regulator [Escherichia coli]